MTELQMGLIGLGATAVIGVVAYNKWQEYKHRKVAEQVLKPHHEDVLLGTPPLSVRTEPIFKEAQPGYSERLEPVLDTAEAALSPAVPAYAEAGQAEMPAVASAPQEEAEEVEAGEISRNLLDPQVDFIVVMELVEAVSAYQILHSQREAMERIGKPVRWVAFNDRTREWELISSDGNQSYRRLRIGLQLADRRGPLADADLTIFVGAVQQLADELLAVADMPPTKVMDQAMELDRFCADVDLEIGVNLVSRGTSFSGTKIRALAEAAGMILGDDGLFTRRDDDGRVQFSLQNYESTLFSPESIKTISTHGLTFLIDVPRVDHGERVYYQMVELAKRFAETLQGNLVDDNRQPLGDPQLDHIKREYIVKTQQRMAQHGIPAGSPQALRLFS